MVQIYLPIAEMSVSIVTLLFMGAGVGVLSGLFGIGGGFLLTPLLIFLGIPSGIAVGTQANQSIASSISGMLAHKRNRNVDIPLALIMLAGGLAGTVTGSSIFSYLQQLGQIDFLVSALYVLFLGLIGFLMLVESIDAILRSHRNPHLPPKPRQIPQVIARLPFRVNFEGSGIHISVLVPALLGYITGITSILLGLNGTLLVPAMIYLMAMPATVVAGTSLFQLAFVSMLSSGFHAAFHSTVDIILALPLMAGGVMGAQIGSRFAGRLRPDYARLLLGLVVVSVALRLLIQLTVFPDARFSIEVTS